MGLYYRIWVDAIIRLRSRDEKNWKFKGMFLMSISMTCNFALFSVILERNILHTNFYKIDMPFFSDDTNAICSTLFLYLLPCIVVNYILILRNNRYEKLLKKYPYHDGKLSITYILISLLLPVILLWIGILFFK